MKLLDKLEKKFGRFHVNNLILYITVLTAFVYVLATFVGWEYVYNLLLVPELVFEGQVWRVFTFVVIPPLTSMLWIVFALYFTYLAGTGLEEEWGAFKFNVYYLMGFITTVVVAFITGMPATAAAINLSLFLAFARVYPDFEILLFFILPVKVKYLGYLNWIFIIFGVITAKSFGGILISLVPAINFLVFFGKDIITGGNRKASSMVRKQKFTSSMKAVDKGYYHKCSVCGVTDVEKPNMQFRYCSKCNGRYCYCERHIKDHEHVK